MTLNRGQVESVKRYLKKSGIENRMVYDDFLDHLCSITEQKMTEGVDFEDAFGLAVASLPYSEMKTTEEYTLKLLNMETSFSRRTSLLATIPFVLFGISWALSNSAFDVPLFVDMFLFYSSIIAMFVLLAVGWAKDFPRWSVPSIGFCALFSLSFMSVSVPIISRELLGFWAWLPFIIAIAVSIAIKPSLKPLKMLGKRIKEEPALVLFALYGFAPCVLFAMFDEIHATSAMLAALLCSAILSAGIYLFLKSERRWTRLLWLVSCAVLALGLAICYLSFWGI